MGLGYVQDEIIIVDEFTGRTMPGRRWGEGLHQVCLLKAKSPLHQSKLTLYLGLASHMLHAPLYAYVCMVEDLYKLKDHGADLDAGHCFVARLVVDECHFWTGCGYQRVSLCWHVQQQNASIVSRYVSVIVCLVLLGCGS